MSANKSWTSSRGFGEEADETSYVVPEFEIVTGWVVGDAVDEEHAVDRYYCNSFLDWLAGVLGFFLL